MIYVTREDAIERLSLSVRTYNCLRRAGIERVGQVLDYPANRWIRLPNLGKKSVNELQAVVEQLMQGGDRFTLVDSRTDLPELPQEQTVFMLQQLLTDAPLEELQLSARAHRCLTNAGYDSIAGLSGITEEALGEIKSMGAKTAQEIMQKLYAYRKNVEQHLEQLDAPQAEPLRKLVDAFGEVTGMTRGELIGEIAACHREHPAITGDDFVLLLCRQPLLHRQMCGQLRCLLEQHEDGLTYAALLAWLPQGATKTVLDSLLAKLIQQGDIVWQEDVVVRCYPTVMDFVRQLPEDRNRKFLLLRLQGATLEEIGQTYGVTRERVRQITQKTLEKHPHLQEDGYQYLFDHYEFSREDFALAFQEPPETYNYLEMQRPRLSKQRPMKEILTDSNVPAVYRRKAERAIYKKYVTIDGVRVEKLRPAMARYVVQTYCKELTSMDTFMEHYQALLERLGLAQEETLHIESRTYETTFSQCDYVLWNQWHRFRYYAIQEREYAPLLDALGLQYYEDMELSSLKLLRDNPELMAEYDIRDEYELHNLLKKIWPAQMEGQRVTFKKMPTIEIGTPDRDQQVRDLLAQHAPIGTMELAEKYEERYGAKAATAQANYFGCIDCYLHNSVYRMDMPPLPAERQERMLQLLTDDFYHIVDVKRLYVQAFPEADRADINVYVLKNLGFRVFSGYVVRDCYGSAADYFRQVLTSADVVDLREQASQYCRLGIYWSIVLEVKSSREVVEYAPNQYIHSRRLAANGVTIADLEQYCNAVAAFVQPDACFTIQSLKQDGFTHPLDVLGYGDWFYASLLVEDEAQFTYQRMGGTKVFCRGQNKVQLVPFLHWLIASEGRMAFQRLQVLLEQRYGLTFNRDKLLEVVRGSELYYDAITETVYSSYDAYAAEEEIEINNRK